jgi:predicted nicotinamide N-methyase
MAKNESGLGTSMAGSWIESTIGPPTECPEDWTTESYRFGPYTIRLAQPRNPDGLLDDPTVQRASKATDYMPYWAFVWPGAPLLADRIASQAWPPGTRAVEIGCGLGLAGLAALAAGLNVTFSDYSPAALALAAHNARLNGFDQFATRIVDWQSPPREPFDVVLGADVLYERRCLPDVLRVLDAMLATGGVALLADPERAVADGFETLARNQGYVVRCEPAETRMDLKRVIRGRIFRVSRRPPL